MKCLGIAFCLLLCAACCKMSLERHAMSRMPDAIGAALADRFGKVDSWSLHEIKPIYANDSICLLQCAVEAIKPDGQKVWTEYRYIYLIDMVMSRFSGKAVYNESLREVPCMPDELIEQSRKDVVASRESVYDTLFGETLPIRE